MRQYEDLLIDALLDSGFNLEEAFRLIALQERYEHEHSWQQDERQLGELIKLDGRQELPELTGLDCTHRPALIRDFV